MSDRRWCDACESIQPEDGWPCLGCEQRREEHAGEMAGSTATEGVKATVCGCRVISHNENAPSP